MYSQGPNTNNASFIDEDREAFLLGRKRVDHLVADKAADVPQVSLKLMSAASKGTIYGMAANSSRDILAKVRDDPLLAFKRQEQMSLQATLANPLKMKKLKKADRLPKEKRERRGKRSREESDSIPRSRSRSPTRLDSSLVDYKRDRSRSPDAYKRDLSGNSPVDYKSNRPRSPVDYKRNRY